VNLSQLMQHVYRENGKIKRGDEFTATGGGTASVINTGIATRPNPYDDDYGIGYTAFVVRDAGGLNAAPENEFAEVTGYASGTQTFSFATGSFTTAVASGDKIALANGDWPSPTLMELANRMLKDIGRIELVDTSLVTVSGLGDHDYTLPVAAKYSVRRVQVQEWVGDSYNTIYQREITPSAPNVAGLITLPPLTSGLTIKLWYEGVHPALTAYSSPISETIDDHVAIAGLSAYAIRWYNTTVGGKNDFWRQRGAEAWQDYIAALKERPIKKSIKSPKWFNKKYGPEYRLALE